jgi:uncharacterized protein YndB with AHSA1/START domain
LKFLKLLLLALIGALGLGFVVLLLLGQRPGAGRNEASIVIARPASSIFPWLTQPEKLEQWIEGLDESMPLTAGGTRVGSRSRDVIIEGGQRYEMETEVTALEPNRLVANRITSAGFDVDGRYELAEQDGTTRVTYTGVARYKMWLAKLMEPVVTPAAQKALEKNMAKLKSQVEATS